MNKFSLVFVCGGTIALALSIVMGWLGVPHMVRGQIKKNARLIKGRDTFNAWRGTTSLPGITKFYIFNVTNPDEVKAGGKVKLIEVGPYTYEEKKLKVDISPGARNHTLQYRNKQLLHFHPEMSTGSEQDVVTFINLPLLILQKLTVDLEDGSTIQEGMNAKLVEAGEDLFKTGTVRDFLFDGVSVETYLDLLQVHESNDTRIPEQFLDGKFALFENRNKTDPVIYEINTGEHNYKDFGRIEARNNDSLLPWWADDTCNTVNGTEGTLVSPFVTPETILMTYSFEICRKQSLIFEKDVIHKGWPGYRFVPDMKTYLAVENNAANWCYCVNSTSKTCSLDGIVSISACSDIAAPFSMSLPHFYQAASSLVEAVDGLNPMAEQHATFIDIEPQTGRALKSVKRLQLNVDLVPSKEMQILSKVQNMVFPILWTEESTEITDRHMRFFGQIKYINETVVQCRWYVVAGSFSCIVFGLIVAMLRRDKIQHQLIK